MRFKFNVKVALKPGLSDPEGETTKNTLVNLGYNVEDVKVSKLYEVILDASSPEEAEGLIDEICIRLLANPTKDNYTFEMCSLS